MTFLYRSAELQKRKHLCFCLGHTMEEARATTGQWTSQFPGPMSTYALFPSSGSFLEYRQAVSIPSHTGPRLRSTHGIEEHSEEELAPIDDLVQLTGASRVFVVEDGVCEEATGLPREDLGGSGRWDMVSPVMVQKIRLLPQDKGWGLLGKMLPYEATMP